MFWNFYQKLFSFDKVIKKVFGLTTKCSVGFAGRVVTHKFARKPSEDNAVGWPSPKNHWIESIRQSDLHTRSSYQ